MAEDKNFGKEKYIFERGRTYVQIVMFVIQFFANMAMAIKLYAVSWPYVAGFIFVGIVGFVLFIRFMRFDIARNMPAEFEYVWESNPAYQRLLKRLDEIEKTVADELSRLQ